MKKVLLIVRAKTSAAAYRADVFAANIRQQFVDDDIQVESCEITELFFELSQESIAIYHPVKKFDLRDFDLVIMRHVSKCWVEAQVIAQYCEKSGISCIDTYLNRLLPDSKLSNTFVLWCNGVTQWPRTMAGPTNELMRRLPELGDKAVLKDSNGLKGRLNFVVSTPKEIQDITGKHPDTQFILQEFIPNEADFRILVLNGQVSMVIRRSGDGTSHLNNTSQGGSAQIVPIEQIPREVIELSIKAANIMKLQVAGVDVMFDARNNDWYFLEVNNAPQISSGSFTQEKLIEYSGMIRSLLLEKPPTPMGKVVIGRAEKVRLPMLGNSILYARIDTGAKTSSIWATDTTETPKGLLVRFASQQYEVNRHQVLFEHYDRVRVASSMGQQELRYRIKMPVVIRGRRIMATFTLSDRSTQVYPVLMGRLTLAGKFIVDVAKGSPLKEEESKRSTELQSNISEEYI